MIISNLKWLAPAVLALALGVSAVAPASEAEDVFRSSVEPTVVTALSETNLTFTINQGKNKLECKKSTLAGTFEKTTAIEISMYPTFSECGATFHPNQCTIRLSGRTDDNNDAAVEIGCPGANEMVFTVGNCEVKVPPHTPAGGVSYTNGVESVGGKERKDVTVKVTITGFLYENVPKMAGGCDALGGAGQGADGTLTGAYTATGYEDSGGPTNGDEFTHGDPVDIWTEPK